MTPNRWVLWIGYNYCYHTQLAHQCQVFHRHEAWTRYCEKCLVVESLQAYEEVWIPQLYLHGPQSSQRSWGCFTSRYEGTFPDPDPVTVEMEACLGHSWLCEVLPEPKSLTLTVDTLKDKLLFKYPTCYFAMPKHYHSELRICHYSTFYAKLPAIEYLDHAWHTI